MATLFAADRRTKFNSSGNIAFGAAATTAKQIIYEMISMAAAFYVHTEESHLSVSLINKQMEKMQCAFQLREVHFRWKM